MRNYDDYFDVESGNSRLIFDKALFHKQMSTKKNVHSNNQTNTGNFVIIAGVNARNFIYQTVDDQNRPVGSLSYALVKAFEALGSSASYKEVVKQINKIYIKKNLKTQQASCEGNTISLVMGGRHIVQRSSRSVIAKKTNNSRSVTISERNIFGTKRGLIPIVEIRQKSNSKFVFREITALNYRERLLNEESSWIRWIH